MVAALHKDGESITKLEKADVLGENQVKYSHINSDIIKNPILENTKLSS